MDDQYRAAMIGAGVPDILGQQAEYAREVLTTERLQEEYEVLGFLAPYVVVRRRGDGAQGTLMFRDHPRIYFGWQENVDEWS